MTKNLWLVIVVALAGCGPVHPRDAQLLERFTEHRAALEQLVRMFEGDEGLGRVGPDFTRPEDPGRVGVSARRIEEYRRLCAAVGADNCIEGYDARSRLKDPIWIHVSASGLSISGSSKGFLYSTNPASEFEMVPDLDLVSPQSSGTWVRHIEGPWYLYFDYED